MNHMSQKMKKLLFHTLVPAVLAVMLLPMTAFAQGSTCTVSIPAKVNVTGKNIPSDVTYQLKLEAVTPGAPMPDVTSLTVKNGEKASFGPIAYAVPEDYQYRVSQSAQERNYFTFDKTVYNVTVRVVTNAAGELSAEIWAVSDQTGAAKSGGIEFNNAYTKNNGGGGGSSSGGSSGGGSRDGLTVINEGTTPLAEMFPTIPDELVPLASLLPKTGDTTNVALWAILMVIFGSGFVLLMGYRKRMD